MKVLHLVHWRTSGIFEAIKNLKHEGEKQGDNHCIITLRNSKKRSDVIFSILRLLQFIFLANVYKHDAIHFHSPMPYLVRFFCLRSKAYLFFHSNYPYLLGSNSKDSIKLFLTKLATKVSLPISVSKTVKSHVDSALGVTSDIIYNLIEISAGEYSPPAQIQKFGSAGRLDKEKNFYQLINGFKNTTPPLSLHIAGTGQQKEQLGQLIASQLSNNISLLGYQASMHNFYTSIDSYICCSSYEGFGLAIVEAISYKKLLISTSVGVLNEDIGFKFIQIDADLSNIGDCIHQASHLSSESIFHMCDHNYRLIKSYFCNERTYADYKAKIFGTHV